MTLNRIIARLDQLAYSELVDMARDAEFDRDFPSNGSFSKLQRKGQRYWYFQRHIPLSEGGGRPELRYVGKVGDPEIEKRVAAFGRIKNDFRARKRAIAQLKSAGLPSPLPIEGNVIKALADAGLFRVNGVLIDSMAYQTYPGLVGIHLPAASLATQDVDFAQHHGISLHIGDKTDDIGKALKAVDPSFRELPNLKHPALSYAYANDAGFKVEFLTSSRGSDDEDEGVTKMPALGGIGASPIRHMDFLIRNPIRSVLIHQDGVSVSVPSPERFAVHKLIVATRRHDSDQSAAKAVKDIRQAGDLSLALIIGGRSYDVAAAWQEAWERGAAWRSRLAEGALRLQPLNLSALADSVASFNQEHGFKTGVPAVETLGPYIKRPKVTSPRTGKKRGSIVG